jgi:hypothetical protein
MGIFDRFKTKPTSKSDELVQPAQAAEAAQPAEREFDAETLASYRSNLKDGIQELVYPGFYDYDEAEERLVETHADDPESPLEPDEVVAALDRVWRARLAEEATWTDEGDYTRLSAAFDELANHRIVAQMNYTCCQNCGHSEIDEFRQDDSLGYVFFHMQDAERLAYPGEPLYLAFGGFGYYPDLPEEIKEQIRAGDKEVRQQAINESERRIAATTVDVLRAHGLSVEWDGTDAARIKVVDLDWRKKLPTD